MHCDCGTTDDDGERMVACERCNQWRHTRCLGVCSQALLSAIPCRLSMGHCDVGMAALCGWHVDLAGLLHCPFCERPFDPSSTMHLYRSIPRNPHAFSVSSCHIEKGCQTTRPCRLVVQSCACLHISQKQSSFAYVYAGIPDEAPPPDPFVCANCRAAEAAAKRQLAPGTGRCAHWSCQPHHQPQQTASCVSANFRQPSGIAFCVQR